MRRRALVAVFAAPLGGFLLFGCTTIEVQAYCNARGMTSCGDGHGHKFTTTSTTTVSQTTTTQPSASWGCNPSEHYGPDGTAMELNSDSFGTTNNSICGNNTSWYADAASSPNGPVQGYPSIKYRYDQSSWVGCCGEPGGSVPLNSVKSWTSSWDVSFDASTNSQAAYDLWFANNCGALGGNDMMVWVDTTASRGNGGGPVINAHATVDGRDVTLMEYGTPSVSISEEIWKFNTNEPSGSVNLLNFVAAGEASGALKACNSNGLLINNADFGFEVAGTSGVVKRFTVNDFHFAVTTSDGTVHG